MLELSQPDLPTASVLKARIVTFMQHASTEITPAEQAKLPELRSVLAPGTQLYVAHTPNSAFEEVIRVALQVNQAGFIAVPHIAVRRIPDSQTLGAGLKALCAAGINEILLIGGDAARPLGEFSSTLAVLESSLLADSGISRVGVAGHPSGHNAVSQPVLWAALNSKQAWAQRNGVRMQVVTQFGLNAAALPSWQRELAARRIHLAVRAGIAGPAPFSKLAHFALQCGVGASLRVLVRSVSAAAAAPEWAITPDQHLLSLCAAPPARQPSAPHFFAFGGTIATASWMRRIAAGDFQIDELRNRFLIGD